MFMRALLSGELNPPRRITPVRCVCCNRTHSQSPLYRFAQLMREEWVACLPCVRKGYVPAEPKRACLHWREDLPA
jgi:hypothetical protein